MAGTCAALHAVQHRLPLAAAAAPVSSTPGFPSVDVQIMRECDADRPLEALLEGQIDLAIMTNPVRRSAASRPAGSSGTSSSPIVANAHPWAQAALDRTSAFAEEHLFIYSADRAEQLHLPLRPRSGRRRACACVRGAADRSDPRARQGRPRCRRRCALGGGPGRQGRAADRRSHHQDGRVSIVDRRHAAHGAPSGRAINPGCSTSSSCSRRTASPLACSQCRPAAVHECFSSLA